MQSRVYNVKAIIEAGLISALIVIIMLLSVYVPIFSGLGTFILPVPVTILYIRHNYKVTLGAVVVSAVIIAMLYNPLSALRASILFGGTGLTLGYCIKNNKEVSTTILFLAIASAISIAVNFIIYATLIDKSGIMGLINMILKVMHESVEMSKEMYGKMGVPSEQLKPLEKSLEIFTADFILKIMPVMLIISSFISAYLNYIVAKVILKKLGYNIKELRPFNQIYINTRIGTAIALCLIIGLLLDRNKVTVGQYIINFSQSTLQFVVILDGLALAAYYLRNRFNISKAVTALILIFTVSPQFLIIYLYAGFADIIFDFRKLDPYRKRLIKE